MSQRSAYARGPVLAVAAVLGGILLVLASRYGPHRDELYFVSAGHRLAWGYPDQPSLVPLLARVCGTLAPHDLTVLRLPSVLTVCLVVALVAELARLLGGDRRGQTVAALVTGTGAVTMFLGHRLTTQTLDVAAWTGVLVIAAHALVEDRPRLWPWAGLVAGIGLNAKHDVVVCLLGLAVGVAATPAVRHHLRSVWWWVAGVVALLLWLPNLVWQGTHGWPVFALSADIRDEYGGPGGAVALVAMTLLVFSPVMSLVWLWGLHGLLRRPRWIRLRPLGWVFVVSLCFFVLGGGKAYYLSGAIPPLLAAGCVLLAERVGRLLPAAAAVLVLSAVVAWPAGLPVLPASTYAASFYPAIDSDQLETIGWPALASTVRGVLRTLPDDAVVLTQNYGEAGALELYDVGAPVFSGHNAWGDWGPPPAGSGPVVVVGYRDLDPAQDFTGCTRAGRVPRVDGADNEEAGGPVYVCAGPAGSWREVWPRLRHLDA